MSFRILLCAIVSVGMFYCGCSSVALSAKDKQAITDFVQKQTGEPVVSLHGQADGDILVQTAITGRGFDRSHFWLLKRAPDGWKLVEEGIVTL